MKSKTACSRCRRTERNRGETFWCYNKTFIFDVDEARKLVAQPGRELFELDEDDVAASIDRCEINEQHVAHVNPDIPGIVAHVYFRDDDGTVVHGHRLIDGHHRATRCVQLNQPFQVYVLTEQESIDILIRAPEGSRPDLGAPVCSAAASAEAVN